MRSIITALDSGRASLLDHILPSVSTWLDWLVLHLSICTKAFSESTVRYFRYYSFSTLKMRQSEITNSWNLICGSLNRLVVVAQVTLNRPPSPDVDLTHRITRRRKNSEEDDDVDDDDAIVGSDDEPERQEDDENDDDASNPGTLVSSDGMYLPTNMPYHIPEFCGKDYMHTDSLWDDITLRGFLPLSDTTNARCAYADISSSAPTDSTEEKNVRVSRIIGAALALSQSKVSYP